MNPALVIAEYVVSVLICTAVAVYSFSRRETAGARAFAVAALGQAFWTLGHLFETLAPSLEGKVFWDDVQFVGTVAWVFGFARFAEAYTKAASRTFRNFRFVSAAASGALLALVFTDRFHHLIRPVRELRHRTPFGELVYPFTPVLLVFSAVMFVIFVTALGALVRHLWRAPKFFRTQIALVVAGELLPMSGILATLAGLSFGADRDTTPYTFALGDLLAAWGLFRYGFLDLVPVARDVVIDGMEDPVVVVDSKNRLLDANAAALAAVNAPLSQLIGRPTSEVYAAFPELVRRFSDMLDGHAEVSTSIGGESRDFDLSITALRDRAGAPIGRVIVARDVTRSKAVERELAARHRELEAAYRDLDAFTHSVSHDLRAPLRAIEGFSDILLRTQQGRLDPAGEEHLRLVVDGAKRMRQLFEDLLRFSRLDRAPLAHRPVDVAELVRGVLAELRSPTAEKVRFEVRELPLCLGDASLLKQVFANLIDNAVKYSRQVEAPRVEIGAARKDGELAYYVADNGVGFDMRGADKLFRVFSRLHDPEQFEGSGVGLAIVASIVKRHGGRIWAESSEGAGATFRFTLPEVPHANGYAASGTDGS